MEAGVCRQALDREKPRRERQKGGGDNTEHAEHSAWQEGMFEAPLG